MGQTDLTTRPLPQLFTAIALGILLLLKDGIIIAAKQGDAKAKTP